MSLLDALVGGGSGGGGGPSTDDLEDVCARGNNLAGGKITGSGTATVNSDLTSKLYVDAAISTLAATDALANRLRNSRTVVTLSAGESPLTGDVLTAGDNDSAAWVHRIVGKVATIPSTGFYREGDVLLWQGSRARWGMRANQDGAFGYAARVNSTPYTENTLINSTSGNRIFVVAVAGTSAGSAPAALATAIVGQRVTDGTAVLECVATALQGPDFQAIPNLVALPITMADSSTTIQVTDGPVFSAPTATANRTKTLGTTGAMKGDVMTFKVLSPAASYSWTFDGNTAGGDSIVIPANQKGVGRVVFNGTNWIFFDGTGTIT
jgi:hypothetical protein